MDKKETRLSRALSQRLFYLSHQTLSSTSPGASPFAFLLTGTSGSIYTVQLPSPESDATPRCNCIDHLIRKTSCKHILFILLRVLKLPQNEFTAHSHSADDLTEYVKSGPIIRDAYERAKKLAPRGVSDDAAAPESVRAAAEAVVGGEKEVERKQIEKEDECAICFGGLLGEELVFCRFGCGNGIHEECWNKYRDIVGTKGDVLKCVLCRSVWEREGLVKFGKRGLLRRGRLVELGEVVPEVFGEFVEDVGENVGRRSRRREEEKDEEHEEHENAQDEDWEPMGEEKNKKKKRKRQVEERRNGQRRSERLKKVEVNLNDEVESRAVRRSTRRRRC